jgi:thiamine biosynthesis lipoprotein
VLGNDLAVATSGAYERGDHIVDGRTGMPARGLLSLTVAGPSLTMADAYATAGFAMSTAGTSWVAGRRGYAPFAITESGRVQYNDAFADLLVTATRASAPPRPQP